MANTTLLILNRKSGARLDIRPTIRPLQKELGFDVVIPWTDKQMRKAIPKRVAKGEARIIAGGGDGTLNSVVNAVLRLGSDTGVSMGLVPLGTANDFARGFGDDASDISHSIRHAVSGIPRRIDVGAVNDQIFVNVASGGFGAMITATTPQEIKKRLGGLAYTFSGLARLSELSPNAARVTLDGGTTQETSILALAIGNSRYAGGGFDVAPDATVDDGLLDLSILSGDLPLQGAADLSELLNASSTSGLIHRDQFRKARIETDMPFHLNLDGEPMVDTKFDISIRLGALNLVLPSPS